ncbi:DUF3253 domain-containing protein [Rhodanobacter sp. ANJX3]|uniref:DUF3253 domain-containing protein n=1 Tax=Rhodanobacter sp. ANJX3 TaxID=2723083 RepID=UPI00160856E4|nr:DUF3253 domain-containing protein [Rhodanobacter sp. ANJX3]
MHIAGKIIDLLSVREPEASICPSEVARTLTDGEMAWRAMMPAVRETAAALARSGRIVITQGDQRIDPNDAYRGPVRLRRGPVFR